MRHAAATVGPLEKLAAAAGYRVESSGGLPLLRYVLAVRPDQPWQGGRGAREATAQMGCKWTFPQEE